MMNGKQIFDSMPRGDLLSLRILHALICPLSLKTKENSRLQILCSDSQQCLIMDGALDLEINHFYVNATIKRMQPIISNYSLLP